MKNIDDMTFNEFCDWACGYILIGIGSGTPLRTLMHTIINGTAMNKVFGGCKSK